MSIRSLNIAGTGMEAQQSNVDAISNNLANVNTTGYKKSLVSFEDLLYQKLTAAGAINSDAGTSIPNSSQIGLGVRVASVYKAFEQGGLETTPGVELNTAIDGVGFYQVTLPNGDIAYSRDGAFSRNANGDLVNANGYLFTPNITIPDNATSITITTDGRFQASIDSVLTELGQIELARFTNPSGLEAIGSNLYIETVASGAPVIDVPASAGFGLLKQYFLESSNVNATLELTNLIKAQRAFELSSKAVQTSEQMLKTAIDTKA